MRRVLLALVGLTIFGSHAGAEISFTLRDRLYCAESQWNHSRLSVVLNATDERDFLRDGEVNSLLSRLLSLVMQSCGGAGRLPGNGEIDVWGYDQFNSPSFRAKFGRSATSAAQNEWQILSNGRRDRLVQFEREQAEKKQIAQTNLDAARAREALAQKFVADFGVQQWERETALVANPFPFQGKVIGTHTRFLRMISASEAIFGFHMPPLLVTGVPSTTFTAPEQQVVLALRVGGTRTVQLPFLGTTTTTVATFVGVHVCKQDDCGDFFNVRR